VIIDLPTSKDFQQAGIGFLNLAWEATLRLLLELKEWDIPEAETTPRDQYWKAAHSTLATATALAQQGIEHLLKAKIAEVNVLLLIAGEPSEWPAICETRDIPFADFRTIDAQDLIRACNAVCSSRLRNDFKPAFEKLRRLRNRIFHTVDKRVQITAEEVVGTILYASDSLIGEHKWIAARRLFVENSPTPVLLEFDDTTDLVIVRELKQIIDILKPAQVKRFIGLDKRQRRYRCPDCDGSCSGYDVTADCAQLFPKSPTATILHCYACNRDTKVVRKRCNARSCQSNVIAEEYETCCLCGEGQ
jgi:hypothetical protein